MKTLITLVPEQERPAHDFQLADHGTIITFHPMTAEAQQWWEEHAQAGPSFGNAYAVDHRFVMNLIHGIEADGLTIA